MRENPPLILTISPLAMLAFLALVGALLAVADGRVQCYECREFGPNAEPFLPGVIKSSALEYVY